MTSIIAAGAGAVVVVVVVVADPASNFGANHCLASFPSLFIRLDVHL